jgi:3-methyladenine DNA glycosylase AlkD
MTTAREILAELEPLGRASYRNVLFNHGIREPCFGVKISELQKIRKRIKKDYQLALDLYDSGNYDAMYLAGLIADDARMTKRDLQHWVAQAYCGALVGSTVAWVAAGSPHGYELALEWIESKRELTTAAGWATLSALVSIREDATLDLAELRQLLERVRATIHQQADHVRYQMNGFVICAGSYVAPLTEAAVVVGEKVGPVTANLGNNACTVPFAPDYIEKVRQRGNIGRKRKTAKC